jgi:hypothetical protein
MTHPMTYELETYRADRRPDPTPINNVLALPGRRVRGPAVYEFSDRNVLFDGLN